MPAPKACVVVIYNPPKDPAAFERYYAGTHLPLLAKHAKEIGHSRAIFTKFTGAVGGGPGTLYRKAELWFDSMAALKRGTATQGFQAVAGDLGNFATGGVSAHIGEVTE